MKGRRKEKGSRVLCFMTESQTMIKNQKWAKETDRREANRNKRGGQLKNEQGNHEKK